MIICISYKKANVLLGFFNYQTIKPFQVFTNWKIHFLYTEEYIEY